MNSKYLFIAFETALLCAFLHSMNCFWFWHVKLSYFFAIAIVCLLLYNKYNPQSIRISKNAIVVSVIFFVAQIYGYVDYVSITSIISTTIYSIIILSILSLKIDLQKRIFDFIYNSLAIILLPSICLFVLVNSGIQLPNWGDIIHPTASFYWYTNYGLLLYGSYGVRFNAIFCEPGHLGMILSFLLFVNGYNLRNKSTWILLIALLLTLSLAGYVLVAMGYFLAQLKLNIKRTLKTFLKLALLLIFIYGCIIGYNKGNNLVNDLIISRLQYDKSEGDFVGNNRASTSLERYYDSLKMSEFIYGIGNKRYMDESANSVLDGAGYMLYIIKYGIIGVIAVFIFYFSVCQIADKRIRYEYISLLILYVLSFLQRSYPFWTSEVFTFILANSIFLTRISINKSFIMKSAV